MKTCCLLSLLLLLLVATANAKSKSGDIFSASNKSSSSKRSRRKRMNSTSRKRKSMSSKSTSAPSFQPTEFPTDQPSTSQPSSLPTGTPSFVPTNTPSYVPTNTPSFVPTNTPTYVPSTLPTELPSASPIVTDCANSFFEIDFEAPVHTAGQRVRTNVGSAGPNSVVFGSPNVVSSYGTLDGQALEFNTVGNSPSFYYDQIRFTIPALSNRFLRLSFDFYSIKTVGTDVQLSVLFDTPTVNVITLTQEGTIRRSSRSGSGPIGSYENGTRYNLVVELDLQQRRWTMYLDDTSLGTYDFFLDNRIQSIRFSYGLRSSASGRPPSDVSMGVDNISICSSSSTFEPTTPQ